MLDQEEIRLRAVLVDCNRSSLGALSALEHPVNSVVYRSDAHWKLVETEATARLRYKAADAALRAYRKTKS
jgi:hypothetical protein